MSEQRTKMLFKHIGSDFSPNVERYSVPIIVKLYTDDAVL